MKMLKEFKIICKPCVNQLWIMEHERIENTFDEDDLSESQLNNCVKCYECEERIYYGEECDEKCKPCNNDYSSRYGRYS